MNFILAGHGNIAVEMKNSIEMIAGEYPNVRAITFQLGDGIETLKDKYLKIINQSTEQPFIIITDIFSGSPYNAAAMLAMQSENIEVISGLSLPLCLALLHLDYSSISLEETFEQLNDMKSDFIKSFKKIAKNIAEEEEL
ncbi:MULTISPECIES: PTS sugar transporter subunit IIA [unclassified Gilliamella]|uniref:PTS sugar transporter subunit IIA n=1 Tax=unclassified Gilliamella TaxID=2685620 RepID=UPI00080ED072|nr:MULTISPECIES: PTS sugar transporter subunit IIA [Gilliamella]MCX8582295.1 PTS sugar transporter subunit IIA [Gilliamella sp. B3482]MCX8582908.1 PTS sugar transporter subunit IIA [Gilliamella sp. B3372]MCX8586469.1 PTS sugar transporter subunit IIA [Gilliamella sp. B3562]MCX8595443.1 PTS sugar transporter subunit IIA [Gilliamella sp. B3367]MCX8596606.1 PTS sugar transporter subunit IIA [Gilliamella sp. B3493]